jgi:hypothetical protein
MALVIVPAYRRDYQTAAEVRKDWEAGKDFKIASVGKDAGRFINNQDAEAYGLEEGSYIRYKGLTELTHVGTWEEAEEEF